MPQLIIYVVLIVLVPTHLILCENCDDKIAMNNLPRKQAFTLRL